MPTLHVVVPCFNEERTVCALLDRVLAVDYAAIGVEPRVWVVDDGSTDGSNAAIRRFVANRPRAPVELIALPRNHGKGRAIREALARVEDGVVLIQDADLEYSPADYPKLVGPILAGRTRVVYGSRRLGGGPPRISGWLYAVGGWLENVVLRLLYRTNITDIATCYKTMDAALLKSLPLTAEGFEFCPEVTARLLNRGERILEAPIAYAPRRKREGKKIRWPDFFRAVQTLWSLRREKL